MHLTMNSSWRHNLSMNPLKVLILIVVIFLSTFTISACPNTVTVKGRAMRETPFGFFVGVPRTLITLYENKEPISARTSNPFGYYSFTNVHVCGQIYDVVAQSKQVDFAPNDYSFTQPPADDDSGVMIFDFVHLNDPPFNSQISTMSLASGPP